MNRVPRKIFGPNGDEVAGYLRRIHNEKLHGLYSSPSIFRVIYLRWGSRWRSWLRHCATSRKVAGSIPDGVIGIFHRHNPSDRTMALGSTQPLTEMSTRNISLG